MLLAAIASMICDRITRSPEILGYTSSIIRDSKYISLPSKDGSLDGLELTKKNWDFPLKMGAVNESGRLRLSVLKHDDAIQMGNPREYV